MSHREHFSATVTGLGLLTKFIFEVFYLSYIIEDFRPEHVTFSHNSDEAK